tara:strand:+ start:6264 stop:6437 length:174 start_codon:yes stop_codon:yes gene_type:complete
MDNEYTDHDLRQVLERIRTWKSEAANWRNDGYVMEGHKERLRTVKEAVTEALKKVDN